MSYRLMAVGEDGMEFCVNNYVDEDDMDEFYTQAEDMYPGAQLWWEQENPLYPRDEDGEYDHEADEDF